MQHKNSWITGKYRDVLKELYHSVNDNFNIVSVEITSDEELICGEIGYMIGKTYTSLSGFTSKDKRYNNYGTLQLVLLAKYLEKNNFFFWNLGHPYMEYKTKLGAKVLDRFDFLKKWNESISC
jgi:Leu/Phe-tRNA-protein transferase